MFKETIIDLILEESPKVVNSRTNFDIYRHAKGEMEELFQELLREEQNLAPGPDGVIGEAIDVILCLVDLLSKKGIKVEDEIRERVEFKLDKWKRIYGEEKHIA